MMAEKPLKVTVGRSGAGKTTLVFTDGQKVVVGTKFLPAEALEGDELYLDLLTSQQYNRTKQEIAKEVLKEILETGDGGEKRKIE